MHFKKDDFAPIESLEALAEGLQQKQETVRGRLLSEEKQVASVGSLSESAESKDKILGKDFRLTWSRNDWNVEELPQPKMRKVRYASAQNIYGINSSRGMAEGDRLIPENILRDAKIATSDSYDTVKDKIANAMTAAYDKIVAANPGKGLESWMKWHSWSERSQGSVLVKPEGAEKLTVQGANFTMNVEFDRFGVYSPNSDMSQAEPHYTKIKEKSASAARKLYLLVQKNPGVMANMQWSKLPEFLKANGVAFTYVNSQW